jgi:hypothetical protein
MKAPPETCYPLARIVFLGIPLPLRLQSPICGEVKAAAVGLVEGVCEGDNRQTISENRRLRWWHCRSHLRFVEGGMIHGQQIWFHADERSGVRDLDSVTISHKEY